jgi:hypothetical protein
MSVTFAEQNILLHIVSGIAPSAVAKSNPSLARPTLLWPPVVYLSAVLTDIA